MKLIAFCLPLCLLLLLGACAPGPQPPAPLPLPEPAASEVEQAPAVETTAAAPAPASPPPDSPPNSPPADAVTTDAAADSTTTTDSIRAKYLERAYESKSLLQVIREAGVPDDNLTPGRKEQIAVYQRQGKYQFYHFHDSRLIAIGEYPRSVIEQMQQQGTYPREVIRDFNGL